MSYAIFLAVGLGIALLIWIIVQAAQRHHEQLDRKMQQAGFFEVKQPDKALVDRIRSLYKRDSDDITIGRLYHRQSSSCELFVLHPHPTEGAGPSVLVRCDHLNLPNLIFNSKVPLDGKVGTLLNKLSEHIISHKLPKVDLTMHPDLAAHYQVFSDDPSRALALITRELTRLLVDSKYLYMISGEGDLFGFSLRTRDFRSAGSQRLTEQEHYPTLADEAERIVEQLTLSQRHPARAF